MNFNKIFIDTNVLIYQTFPDYDTNKHQQVISFFEKIELGNVMPFISHQVLYEYFAISTNSKFFSKPLSTKQALLKIEEFNKYFSVLLYNEQAFKHLKLLLKKYNIKRQKIYDTNIVATMISFEISEIFSFNRKDFVGFDEINIVEIL